MAKRPLRLRRALNKITSSNPAFTFYSDVTGALYDDDIHEVTIHRGKNGRGGGHTSSTLEMSVNGLVSAAVTGANCRFMLRDLAADDLAAHTGQTRASIQYRFQGRAGVVDVEDTPKKMTSTVAAASWLARMYRSSRKTTPLAGQTVARVFTDVLDLANSPRGLNINFAGTFDPLASNQDPVTFTDALSKFGSDIGICFFEKRDGSTTIMSLPYRKTRTDGRAATWLPLTRSQAISPANWKQANEYTAIRLLFNVTNANGNVVTRTAEIETGDSLKESVTEDWAYIKSDTNGTSGQLYQEAYGRVYESNTRVFSIPSVKIDLLYLLTSDKDYHRKQAGQLLTMEVGDPVFFSGDWPTQLAGTHLAEGITETITPTRWEIELHMLRYAIALGDAFQPEIKPRVWDSATKQWNAETLQWDQS